MAATTAYIVAARRTAIGRIGGLHRNRRIEDLTAPVVVAALKDAKIAPDQVDEIIIGNATAGGNPARLIALAAGLPDTVPAYSVDRQCASGLDAILSGLRSVGAGESNIVVAGGAEALSTAPWRVTKPRNLYQLPRFVDLNPTASHNESEPELIEASEVLARKLAISRERQDIYALESHLKASQAQDARRFVGEIVPLRVSAEEARDESPNASVSSAELADMPPYVSPDGTVTPGNSSTMHDGAAIAVIVSDQVYQELGAPPALRLIASAAAGVAPDDEGSAPVHAMQKLYRKLNGQAPEDVAFVEVSETSAAQGLALRDALNISACAINPDGGAVARGHPYGASGAILVTRLFTHMARQRTDAPHGYGAVATGAVGGLGLAALFESV